jgi:hypothetical protein
VQLYEIHIHAKYQVAIFHIAKVMANVKVLGRRGRWKDKLTMTIPRVFLKTAEPKITDSESVPTKILISKTKWVICKLLGKEKNYSIPGKINE